MLSVKHILKVSEDADATELHIHPTKSLGDLFDDICKMRQFIVDKIVEAHKSQQPVEQSNPPVTDELKA